MIAVETGGVAGHVVTITTNGANVHSAADWARGTSKQLVAVDTGVAPERLKAAFRLRGKVFEALHECFSEIQPGMPEALLDQVAREASDAVFATAAGTPWEEHFADPQTRTAMALCIWRNIHDAARQAVTRE